MNVITNPVFQKEFSKMFTVDTFMFFIGYGMIVYRFGWFNAIMVACVLSSVELGAVRGAIWVGDNVIKNLKSHDEKPRGYEHK